MFYFTDVHGNMLLYEKAMEIIKDQPFIFGGDACDRGHSGYSIMRKLLDNPKCTYLKGNHEDMFVKAARFLRQFIISTDAYDETTCLYNLTDALDADKNHVLGLYLYNDGLHTIIDWYCDGMPMDFVDKIDNLEYGISYNNYDFCHAGALPKMWDKEKWDDKDFEFLLWDRQHFSYGWFKDRMLIHGHTPVDSMPGKYAADRAPILYCGKTRLNMDGGASYNHQLFLLNIDDWKFWRITAAETKEIVPLERKKAYYDVNLNLILPNGEEN